ncbi:MAG: flagellar hook-length control protein FliK [Eubacteriales bacterium]|nr:flagellar hook-length control protein FliK [Eubacteriales bacterium]MDN5363881.1 flagellar hook-length control protein FliK [Eubacteriales bacterium]
MPEGILAPAFIAASFAGANGSKGATAGKTGRSSFAAVLQDVLTDGNPKKAEAKTMGITESILAISPEEKEEAKKLLIQMLALMLLASLRFFPAEEESSFWGGQGFAGGGEWFLLGLAEILTALLQQQETKVEAREGAGQEGTGEGTQPQKGQGTTSLGNIIAQQDKASTVNAAAEVMAMVASMLTPGGSQAYTGEVDGETVAKTIASFQKEGKLPPQGEKIFQTLIEEMPDDFPAWLAKAVETVLNRAEKDGLAKEMERLLLLLRGEIEEVVSEGTANGAFSRVLGGLPVLAGEQPGEGEEKSFSMLPKLEKVAENHSKGVASTTGSKEELAGEGTPPESQMVGNGQLPFRHGGGNDLAMPAGEGKISVFKLPFSEQLAARVKVLNRTGNSEMTIALEPEFLGKLALKIKVEDGMVKLTIGAENGYVKQLLEASLPQLKEQLQQQGLILDQVQVFLQQTGSDARSGGGDFFRRQRDYPRGRIEKESYPSFSFETLTPLSDYGDSTLSVLA